MKLSKDRIEYLVYNEYGGICSSQLDPFIHLMDALKLAMKIEGVIYNNRGEFIWEYPNPKHKFGFTRHKQMSTRNLFCLCDICQDTCRRKDEFFRKAGRTAG